MKYEVVVGEDTYIIEINRDGSLTINGEAMSVDFGSVGSGGIYSLLVNNESFEALIEQQEGIWVVLMRGERYEVEVLDERTQLLRARSQSFVPESGELIIRAPMPGLVVAIPVTEGQEVEVGDNIIILESMKMENELKAPRKGRIERISVSPGNSVEQHQTLVVIV